MKPMEFINGWCSYSSLMLFLSSAGESRVKGSPARPSESASSQQSRSSSEADPLSKCLGLFRNKWFKIYLCRFWPFTFSFN